MRRHGKVRLGPRSCRKPQTKATGRDETIATPRAMSTSVLIGRSCTCVRQVVFLRPSMTITKHVLNTPLSCYPGTGSRASRHPRSGSYSIRARTPPRFFAWRVNTLCDCAVLHVSSPTVSEPKEITFDVDSLQLTRTTLESHTSSPSRACGGCNACLQK